jgi:hypothetical protein
VAVVEVATQIPRQHPAEDSVAALPSLRKRVVQVMERSQTTDWARLGWRTLVAVVEVAK